MSIRKWSEESMITMITINYSISTYGENYYHCEINYIIPIEGRQKTDKGTGINPLATS
jgi:hypothetical protein